MENNNADVAAHLVKLIDLSVPTETTEKARQKYLTYFMRILGSRLQSASFKDSASVKSLITRKLANAKSSKHGTKNTDLQKFEDLYTKFNKRKGIDNKSSMLYLLYKISKVQEEQNTAQVFQSMLPQVDDEVKEDNDEMDVDEQNVGYSKNDRKLGQLEFLKSFRYRSQDLNEESVCK
jgi:hypothetical protein